jgi:protein O-GlcNAc transferase
MFCITPAPPPAPAARLKGPRKQSRMKWRQATIRKRPMPSDPVWQVKIHSDVTVCVSPNIQQMTSYILLEQEDWFEDEMAFIRAFITPDMNAFDIGANHGVYGLTIANQLVSGHVWAFEPTQAPGRMLARSIDINGFATRMRWIHAGLSDHDGSAEITISANSETNSLYGTGGEKETIALEGLDAFIARQSITATIDFVKLDAEGEEIRILAGGQDFFSHQSPLIMFELKHGNQVNHGLIEAIQALGYGIYRLAPGLGLLVVHEPEFGDSFLLNLFACKPDLVETLAARGLLATPAAIGLAEAPLESDWRQRLFALPFANRFRDQWQHLAPFAHADHECALSACLLAQDTSLAPARRALLARQALAKVTAIADSGQGDVALWLLRLNLTHLLGERALSVGIARKLAGLPPALFEKLALPFLPPAPRFYDRDLGPTFRHLPGVIAEFIEYRQSYSSYYASPRLDQLSALTSHPGHGLELDRRLILAARRQAVALNIAETHPLFDPAISANAAIWRTIVKA